MKVAVPIAQGKLSMHFGHCEEVTLIDVDPSTKEIAGKEILEAPPHQPGLLPEWLHERGADVIIAGGMGERAKSLFYEKGITVVTGAAPETPDELVRAYLDGSLELGENACDR